MKDALDILEQREIEKWFVEEHGCSPWTTLYRGGIPLLETGVCLYSYLIDTSDWDSVRQDPTLALEPGHCTPGFSQQYGGAEPTTRYHRYGRDNSVEPLVIVRYYPNIRPKSVEVVEELRHLFSLCEDTDRGVLNLIEDDGSETPVVRMSDKQVDIYTPLLVRYLAVKQKSLVLMIDSDVWIEKKGATDEIPLPEDRVVEEDNMHLHYYSGEVNNHIFSRISGKKMILPPDISVCGIWPFEEEKEYVSFIIGEDERGKPIEHTSDPDALSNYFGANPGAPHHLTPVFFDPEVLRKYYENTECYEVQEGMVSYRGLWILRVDNDSPGHVAVFLGDLGRDLPTSEQRYWRAFNVPRREKGLSETTFRRSFLGEWADTKSPEHRFKRVYTECKKKWSDAFGWPLFRDLREADKHVLDRLRIPLKESIGEFDDQILNLAKLIIDSLSESDIVTMIKGPLPKDAKGITKLETFFKESGFVADIKLLRTIQEIRSTGAAHLKSEKYDLTEAGLDPENLRGSFSWLLERVTMFLVSIELFAQSAREQT
jgi:hypothetical protein